LRRAIGDGQGGHRYVVTVPGRGYNLSPPSAQWRRRGPRCPRQSRRRDCTTCRAR
jgi:DNA-binding winged helix-turn-helix (wHTH) protein